MIENGTDNLPSSWALATLGEAGIVITGNTPPTSHSEYYGGHIPFIKPPLLLDKTIGLTPDTLTSEGANYSRIVPPNAVLVSCIGNLGKTGFTSVESAFNQQINAIIFGPAVYPRYGFYACQLLRPFLEAEASATTIAIVNKSKFSQAPISIAPLLEQRRIVAEIEKQFSRLDAGVTALKKVQANLKRYRAAVLQAACEGRLVPTEAELARAEGRDYEPASCLLERIGREREGRGESRGVNRALGRAVETAATRARSPLRGLEIQEKMPAQKSIEFVSTEGREENFLVSGVPAGDFGLLLPQFQLPANEARNQNPSPRPDSDPSTFNLPELPEGWCWTTVGQLADVATGATPLRGKAIYYDNGTIPWITSGALNASFVDSAEEFITPTALKETNAKIFPAGTLLLAMYGEGKTRGKVSELRIDAATNQACAAILSRGSDCKTYMKLFFQKNYEDIRRLSSGGVQPNLNLSIVRMTRIPLPPLAEQQRIVEEVERRLSVVEEIEAVVEANLKRAERLRQAILQRAFSGKLAPQDPNDEPASVLLERIREERGLNRGESRALGRAVKTAATKARSPLRGLKIQETRRAKTEVLRLPLEEPGE